MQEQAPHISIVQLATMRTTIDVIGRTDRRMHCIYISLVCTFTDVCRLDPSYYNIINGNSEIILQSLSMRGKCIAAVAVACFLTFLMSGSSDVHNRGHTRPVRGGRQPASTDADGPSSSSFLPPPPRQSSEATQSLASRSPSCVHTALFHGKSTNDLA